MTSIGYANQILSGVATYIGGDPKLTDNDGINTVNYIIREAYRLISMNPLLIMMDVRSEYAGYIDKWFAVQHKYEYTSTNGSKMVLYMVKLKPDVVIPKTEAK